MSTTQRRTSRSQGITTNSTTGWRAGAPGLGVLTPSPPRSRSTWFAAFLLLASLAVLPAALPSVQAAPYSGPEPTPTNLTVFLHNSTSPQPITGGIFSSELLTSANDSASPWRNGGYLDLGRSCVTCVIAPFYLFPRVAGPLTLNGTPTGNVFVNYTGTSVVCTVTLNLLTVDPSGTTAPLGAPSTTSCTTDRGSIGLPVHLVYGSSLLFTLPAGWSIEATITLTGSASNPAYGLWWGKVGSSSYPSDLDLPASTYLAINQTYVVGPNGAVASNLNTSVKTPVAQLRANLTDPLGNYDYTNWSVNWTVTSATGSLFGAGPMMPFGPTVPPAFYAYNETYTAAYNYSWLPSGSYTFCANATDNTAHNDLLFSGRYGRAASGCTTFFIGSAPNLLTLHVLDSKNLPLAGAWVDVASIINSTDASGTTHYRLPNGTYAGSVKWEGVVVATPSLTVRGPTVVTVTTSVYYPTFSIVDHSGTPLSDALVYVVHPNGSQYPLRVTGAGGNLTFSQVPGGSYGITVLWHDSAVYLQPGQPAISVGANTAYVVTTHVYWQGFRVQEPTGSAIALADVVVENFSTGVVVSFGITDASGSTTAHVPYGNFSVLVYWQTSLVAELNLTLLPSQTDPYVITAAIFQVNFLALDSEGHPVGGAAIEVVGAGGPITNLVTSPSGTGSTVLPGGSYTFVTRWEGVTVNVSTAVISSATSLTLDLSIYYVDFTAVDAKTFPVAGATIAWTSVSGYANGSVLTNDLGSGVARLPATTFDLSLSWEGVAIGASVLNVSSSMSEALSLEVYYVELEALDSKGVGVGDATVALSLTNGPLSQLFLTATNGTAVARLPNGTYEVAVSWEGVSVYNGPAVQASSDATSTLSLEVYYLTVDTVDNGGSALAGVFLQVLSSATGAAVASATTTSGVTVFRLPVGSYWVVGTLKATYSLTPVEQTLNQTVSLSASQSVTLKFTRAPPPFSSTNEFYVILGFVALIVLLVLVIVLLPLIRKRRGKGGAAPPAESSEKKGNELASDGGVHEGLPSEGKGDGGSSPSPAGEGGTSGDPGSAEAVMKK